MPQEVHRTIRQFSEIGISSGRSQTVARSAEYLLKFSNRFQSLVLFPELSEHSQHSQTAHRSFK